MTRDPFADEDGELAVPVGQDRGEFLALLAATPRHAVGAEASLGPLAHPVDEAVTLLGCHSERVGEVVPGQVLAHGELENELVPRVEAPGRPAQQFGEVLELGGVLDRVGLRRGWWEHHLTTRLGEVGDHRLRPSPRTPVHLVAEDGEEPGLETRRIAELVEFLGGQHEDVLDHVRGVLAVAGHRRSRVVERVAVAIPDGGERGPIAGKVRGDGGGVGGAGGTRSCVVVRHCRGGPSPSASGVQEVDAGDISQFCSSEQARVAEF